MKLCKDCRWCRPLITISTLISTTDGISKDYSVAQCVCNEVVEEFRESPALVTGEKTTLFPFCASYRDRNQDCEYWEAIRKSVTRPL